jgi:hypothetical protein
MSNIDNVAANHKAMSDVGSVLVYKTSEETLYHLAFYSEGAPAFGSTPGTIDITPTISEQPLSINDRVESATKEFTSYAHRDNKIRLERLAALGELSWMWLNQDGTGIAWKGSLVHYQGETSKGAFVPETVSISTVEASRKSIKDGEAFVQQTAKFGIAVPADTLVEVGKTKSFAFIPKPTGATVTAKAYREVEDGDDYVESVLETDPVEVTTTGSTVTIEGIAEGRIILYFEVTGTGVANDFVTTRVIVSPATVTE